MGYAFGTYEHQIDAKGRMRIPAKIKSSFGEQMMVTTGIQGCLYIYPESKFLQIAEKIETNLSSFDDWKLILSRANTNARKYKY